MYCSSLSFMLCTANQAKCTPPSSPVFHTLKIQFLPSRRLCGGHFKQIYILTVAGQTDQPSLCVSLCISLCIWCLCASASQRKGQREKERENIVYPYELLENLIYFMIPILTKPYETNCGLWIWAIQIKFDWLICLINHQLQVHVLTCAGMRETIAPDEKMWVGRDTFREKSYNSQAKLPFKSSYNNW